LYIFLNLTFTDTTLNQDENMGVKPGALEKNELFRILKMLPEWVVPPSATISEEASRKANLLTKIVLAAIVANTIGYITALFEPKNKFSTTTIFYGLVYLAFIGIITLLRRGRVIIAGWSLIIFMWFVIGFATLFFGGLQNQIPVVFVIAIMFMGSFLGGRPAVILALITICFLGLVAFLELNDSMPPQLGPEYSPVNAWSALCVALLLMSILLQNLLASIKESEERYQLAVRGSAAGLWDWDLHTNEVYYSTSFKEMLGYSQVEFPYSFSTLIEAVHPDDRELMMESRDKHLVSHHNRFDAEFRLRIKGGDYRWFHSRGEAVRDDQGKPYRMAGSIVDITIRKLAEESIAQKNAELLKTNEELDRFVYSASHDLRAPIASLLGLIEVARLENDIPSIRKLLKMQERSLLKLDNFIFDIVSYSRNNRVEMEIEKINFRTLLDNVYDLLHHMDRSKEIKKIIEIDSNLSFHGDKKRIYIILNNLISNAIKYSDPSKPDAYIKILIDSSENGVRIRVVDNGEGIDTQNINRIFDMFYRASVRSDGSGIGLYIVKEVIQKLHGTIEVHSQRYQGTEFTIHLPDMKRVLATPPKT